MNHSMAYSVHTRRRGRAGFSLVELLMVVCICNILLCLLFPAVQAARESANRVHCANHLKQLGLAWQMHNDAHKHLPTGGWGWNWTGDPNRGFGQSQPGAWAYNVLPYIEENAVYSIGAGLSDSAFNTANVQRLSTLVPLLTCPSRRSVTLYPNIWQPAAINCDNMSSVFRGDYAASVGNPNTPVDPANCGQWFAQCNGGPPSLAAADSGTWSAWTSTTAFNGVCFQRSMVSFREITDGLSHTVMIGEKYLDPLYYDTGTYGSDNESAFAGFDDDLCKTTGLAPAQDDPMNSDPQNTWYSRFGSIHSSALNMTFCDGSVHQVAYEIDTSTFSALGSRNGSETIDASMLNP